VAAGQSSAAPEAVLEATGADLAATSLWQALRQIRPEAEPGEPAATASAA
jgi:hypothetical protein